MGLSFSLCDKENDQDDFLARCCAKSSRNTFAFSSAHDRQKISIAAANRAETGPPTSILASLAVRRGYPAIIHKLAPHNRLSMIARHLDPRPQLSINTPFSTERSAPIENPRPPQPRRYSSTGSQTSETTQSKMSSQPNHPALLIPGPIEFDDAVLQSMSHYRYVQDPLFKSSSRASV